MRKLSTKVLVLTLAAASLSGCLRDVSPPTNGVPCIAIKPHTDALRAALIANPKTPEAVGQAGADVVLGTEAVCG